MRVLLLLWFIQVSQSYQLFSILSTSKFDHTNVISLGWVPMTEIGAGIEEWMNKYAPNFARVTPHNSAAGCVKIFETVIIEQTNSFWNYDGTNFPW